MKKGIGIFDSGLGGLTVVKEVMRLLPQERIVYFGDTARVPYGSKSKKVIIKFAKEIIRFLKTKNIKILVIACNTATAFALKEVSKILKIPIIGVIKPGSKRAVETTRKNKIGIIGTKGTISSNSYYDEIKKINSEIDIEQNPCPLFVPLIEEGMLEDNVTFEMANRYLEEIKGKIDTLVLGCTHYPMIKKVIKKVVGKDVILIDSAEEVAIEVRNVLYRNRILLEENGGENEFYVSDSPRQFMEIGKLFLGDRLENVELIDIEKYSEEER
ncbi:MAG: glutamate racemase [Fusobacteriota bacterium]